MMVLPVDCDGRADQRRNLIPPLQAHDRVDRQFGVDVRKQLATARGLPANGVAEEEQVHLGDHQAALAREIFLDRRLELLRSRQMDIAVGDVHRRAAKLLLPKA